MAAQPNTIVRLSDYCVAEFSTDQFTVSPAPLFYKLYNVETGTHHIYNPNGTATMNTQDYSVTNSSNGQYIYMNQEVAVPYWDRYPDKFIKTTPGVYDTFNKVRFHFTSGFDFTGQPGLILSVKNKMNNGTYVMFAQVLITAELYEDLVKFNTSPIYLADAIFDRYVEVWVPAISVINQDYYALPPESRSGEFGALITYNGTNYSGFVQNAPIMLSVDEVSRLDTVTVGGDMYQLCIADQHYESVVSTDSMYQRFGVFIGESDQFDALEFYATMLDEHGNVAFVEELINDISTNAHDDWVIAHQLVIHEWIGGVKSLTGRYMMLQETDFDSPQYYRPILKNASMSLAFEVDYTCRLYNRRNGDQLIRLGSYSSYNTRKYGRSLEVIRLDAEPSSHMVYNKIFRSSLETTELFIEQNYVNPNAQQATPTTSAATQQAIMSFIPMFFNVNAISVSMKDALVENEDVGTTLVYKQGDLMFVLNPFDNMFKFKVHTLNNNGNLVPMDLSGFGKFNIVFMDNNKKVKFGYLTDSGTSNPAIGELMFKVPQSDAEILITSSTREWYITLVAADNTETMLYNGFWKDVTEKDEVDANVEKVRLIQSEILGGDSVSYFSTQTGTFTVPTVQPAEQPATTQSGSSSNETKVYIPGYVPAGNSGGDVSIIKIVSPSLLKSTGDAKQSKADSALSKALGNQARKTVPKRG